METKCLIADDAETAEILASNVSNDKNSCRYIGIALFPEAAKKFKEYGLEVITADNYISDKEHERAVVFVSDFMLNLKNNLNLTEKNNPFVFENYNHFGNCSYFNYLVLGHCLYFIIIYKNIIENIKPDCLLAVDIRRNKNISFNMRPRSQYVETLMIVGKSKNIPIELVSGKLQKNKDTLTGLSKKKYKYRNHALLSQILLLLSTNPFTIKIKLISLFQKCLFRFGMIKNSFINSNNKASVLCLGGVNDYSDLLKQKHLSKFNKIVLNLYSYTEHSKCYQEKDVVFINSEYLIKNYLKKEDGKKAEQLQKEFFENIERMKSRKNVKNNFIYQGISFFEIITDYMEDTKNRGFLHNLKLYMSMKCFIEKHKIFFAIDYGAWLMPEALAVLGAFKKNNVITSYVPHGLNVMNKKIIRAWKGSGWILPCDVLFAPGEEHIRGYIENGLKNGNNNFVTGIPSYKKSKYLSNKFKRLCLKRILGVSLKKKIILYTFTRPRPLVIMPGSLTFVEDYVFVKTLIKTFKDSEFQLVLKSKHKEIPDSNYLKLFHENYPDVIYRAGPIEHYLKVSDVVINFTSSVGFEALFAGIPVIYFTPNDRHDWFEPYASKQGEKNFFLYAKTYDEILKLSRDIVTGKLPEWYRDKMNEAHGKFLAYTGKESAKKISEIILNFSNLRIGD